jgi:hypothetical protein
MDVLAMTFFMSRPEVTAHVLIDAAAGVEHRLTDAVASKVLRLPAFGVPARHIAAGVFGALGLFAGFTTSASRRSADLQRSDAADAREGVGTSPAVF